jgi:LysM repeat protein
MKENKTEEKTENQMYKKIWDEIKGVSLNLYGLQNQFVVNHCILVDVMVKPDALHVKPKSSAVLPALEEALSKTYTVELVDKYIEIKRKV